jgi:uncharacterized protein YndB with AHSA1/START domain
VSTARSSITIDRSIEDVFGVLTNVENTATWFPWKVAEHWTSPPPHGVGSTRHAVVAMFGRKSENDAVTTEYDPPRRAAMRGLSPNAPFHAVLEFRSTPAGTRVDVTTTMEPPGVARLVGPIFTALYGRAWTRGLETLKRLMESGAL